jgi:hypothetical protein
MCFGAGLSAFCLKNEEEQNEIKFSLPLNVAVVIEGAREAGDLKLLRVVLEIILREPVGQFTHVCVLRNVERLLQHLGCNIIYCHQDLQRFGDSSFRNLRLELPGCLRHMKPKELQQQQQQQQSGPKHGTIDCHFRKAKSDIGPFDEN